MGGVGKDANFHAFLNVALLKVADLVAPLPSPLRGCQVAVFSTVVVEFFVVNLIISGQSMATLFNNCFGPQEKDASEGWIESIFFEYKSSTSQVQIEYELSMSMGL